MTRILLIRHGANDLLGRVLYGRTPGIYLNAEGQRQAEALAAQLSLEFRIDAVVSSPLERALETARPLAQAQDNPIIVDDGITEVDFGSWAGQSFEQLNELAAWHDFNLHRPLRCAPGGESMMAVQARAWRTVAAFAQRYPERGTIAFVSHGDVIRCLLLLLLGMSIDHIHRLEVSPGSVSEILLGEHHPLLRRMNQTFASD